MESVENNQFDHEVKSKFEDFTPSVPVGLWDKIESQLSAIEPTKSKPIKRLRFSFFAYGSVAATLLVAFTFWKFSNTENIHSKESVEVLVSKVPFERNLPQKEDRESDVELNKKGEILEADRLAAVVSKKTRSEQPNIKRLQVEVVESNSIASLEPILEEDDFSIAYIEPTHSVVLYEMPALAENAPFDTDIMLQGSLPLQEDASINPIEEIDKPKNKRLGVSTVLNFLAKGLANESGNSVEFSESDEGVLKLDIKRGLARGND